MGFGDQLRVASCCLLFSTSFFAASITGRVTNGTTNKPAAGAEVVLLSLSGGMQETGRTTTDSKGQFSVEVPDEGQPHLIRAAHQGVHYYRQAPPGTTTVEVTVYDAAKKVDHLIGEGRVFLVHMADGQQMRVTERHILLNESQPPRTWAGERTFEVVLPDGAALDEGMAAGPSGLPVTSPPVPTGVKNHYAFTFPVRPGRTEFRVTYKLPYSGTHDFTATPDIPLDEFGVMLPKGIRFTSSGESFVPATEESGMTVFVAKSIPPGQQLKFTLAGEGTEPREAQGGAAPAQGSEGASSAPGGGLGAPNSSPTPLSGAARWYILGIALAALIGFAVWMLRRKPVDGPASTPASGGVASAATAGRTASASATRPGPRPAVQGSMLDALKDELFQLESDRLQGKISQQDYQTAKNGLDVLLRRHMKRGE
jgi:Carboxypeptidase regulatory-like domain